MSVEIYSLRCPITNEIRYIGKANNSAKRLKTHLRDSRTRNTPVYCWIRMLQQTGLIPIVEVLHVIIEQDWRLIEKKEILIHRNAGAKLLNVADGGDEPFCSKEQRILNGSATFKKLRNENNYVNSKVFEYKRRMASLLIILRKKSDYFGYNRIILIFRRLAIKNTFHFSCLLKYKMLNFYGEEIE